jgi:polar amino acid transport system substrate-binding protein
LLADDYDQAVTMVRKDQAQAMVADMAICQLSVLRYPEAGLAALGKPISYEPLGIAVPPNDPLLVNLLQNFLNMMDKDGTMDMIAKRWFKDSSWVSQMR